MFTKKIKLVLVAALVTIGGIAGIAAAEGPRHHDKGALKAKFDLNKDGTLDATERASMKAAFGAKRAERKAAMVAKFDTNRNGAIDPAEKQVMHDTRAAARFSKLDTNRDGQLSLAEFKAGKGKHDGKRHGRRGMGRTRP